MHSSFCNNHRSTWKLMRPFRQSTLVFTPICHRLCTTLNTHLKRNKMRKIKLLFALARSYCSIWRIRANERCNFKTPWQFKKQSYIRGIIEILRKLFLNTALTNHMIINFFSIDRRRPYDRLL